MVCDICKRANGHGDVLLTLQHEKNAPFTICGECWVTWAPERKRDVDTKRPRRRAHVIVESESEE